MTFLDMVNNVLRRLRERPVADVRVNDYVRLIGILINDARREVGNSWDWSSQRVDIPVTTVAGTAKYELNDTLNRTTVLDVWDDTNDLELRYMEGKKMRQMIASSSAEQGKPMYYTYSETSSDGDTQLSFYPIPDDAYNITVRSVQRDTDLVANSDITILPTQPILLLAYAKAVEERGEDAGVAASAAYALAYKSLADHLAMDANRRPEEITWYEV